MPLFTQYHTMVADTFQGTLATVTQHQQPPLATPADSQRFPSGEA